MTNNDKPSVHTMAQRKTDDTSGAEKRDYVPPSMVTEDLPSQLTIGQCSLDPDKYGCSLTTNYESNSSWETGFPGFCHI